MIKFKDQLKNLIFFIIIVIFFSIFISYEKGLDKVGINTLSDKGFFAKKIHISSICISTSTLESFQNTELIQKFSYVKNVIVLGKLNKIQSLAKWVDKASASIFDIKYRYSQTFRRGTYNVSKNIYTFGSTLNLSKIGNNKLFELVESSDLFLIVDFYKSKLTNCNSVASLDLLQNKNAKFILT